MTSKRFRLPLSDEQRQYLLSLVEQDRGGHRQYLKDLLERGNEMVTDLECTVSETEAHLSRATGMAELLKCLAPVPDLPKPAV